MFKIIAKSCKDCDNLYTDRCPIRVWCRNEGDYVSVGYGKRSGLHMHKELRKVDVDISKDFCSRYRRA